MIVKNCRNCGPLTKDQVYNNGKCKVCSLAYSLQWAKKNKEKRKETSKLWKIKNPTKIKNYRDKYNTVNHHHKILKDREYGKNYYQRNIDERRKTLLMKSNKKIETLHNTYVKSKISRQYKIKGKDVPLWMVEIKRPLLMIKRKIREIKNGN